MCSNSSFDIHFHDHNRDQLYFHASYMHTGWTTINSSSIGFKYWKLSIPTYTWQKVQETVILFYSLKKPKKKNYLQTVIFLQIIKHGLVHTIHICMYICVCISFDSPAPSRNYVNPGVLRSSYTFREQDRFPSYLVVSWPFTSLLSLISHFVIYCWKRKNVRLVLIVKLSFEEVFSFKIKL